MPLEGDATPLQRTLCLPARPARSVKARRWSLVDRPVKINSTDRKKILDDTSAFI